MVISDDVWGIQAFFLLKLGIHFPHSLQRREWWMISSLFLYVLKMEDLEIMKFLSSKGNTVPYFRFIFIRRSMLTRKSLIKEVRKLTCPYITEKSPKIIQLVIINFEILKISLYKKKFISTCVFATKVLFESLGCPWYSNFKVSLFLKWHLHTLMLLAFISL